MSFPAVVRGLALLLLVAAGVASGAQAIRVVEVHPIDSPSLAALSNGTLELKLYAHAFRGTRWKQDDIVGAVLGSARLLAQCGITVNGAELRIIDAPRSFQVFHTPTSRELLRRVEAPRPAVFFVEDTRNDPAFDAEAVGHANSAQRPELVNTVWVAHGARDLAFALAHELVHVLSDSGDHTDEPGNLMRAETAPENTRLNAAQCERMRSRGEANGLLRRRGR